MSTNPVSVDELGSSLSHYVMTVPGAGSNGPNASSNNGNKKKPPPQQKQQQGQKKGKGGNAKQAPPAAPKKEVRPWNDELQVDYDRILSVGEECISPEELKTLLTAKGRGSGTPGFNLYDGFEPSGRMHIAQGVFKAMNVNKCTAPGTNGTFVFWVADWFALMNDKMGGDLEKIKTVGHYLIEVWKAAGMDLSHVVFKWASEEITQQADKYWPTMLDVARRFNVTRIKKCCQIMGRLEGSLTAAQILYPLMQCTDVFFLKADICQLGVDQRKVNMLAREYCDPANANIKYKPIILSHHMLYGLKAGQEKMSKSDPDSAVFMEDSAEDVERKINNAYCPTTSSAGAAVAPAAAKDDGGDAGKESMNLSGDTLKNPCLDYIQNIIFSPPGATFTAGGTTFENFVSVREAFLGGSITEAQLKKGLIDELNRLLEPVRTHFTTDERAKDLLAKVQQFKKESAAPGTTEKVERRLNLVELSKVPAQSHLAFAPLPTAAPTLQQAVDVLAQLRGNSGVSKDAPRVLFLSDWTARVCNACMADTKAITAFYTVLVESLKALDPALMAQTQVLLQSEAILADPSNYWISVINVGRNFMLDEVMGSFTVDSDGVGGVIGRLMRVADVVGVEPKTVSLPAGEPSEVEQSLVERFVQAKVPGMKAPEFALADGAPILLQKVPKADNDQYFLLDIPKNAGAQKMKKAFCEPQNIEFCPPIQFARVFVFGEPTNGTLSVSTNSGEKVYQNAKEVEADFQTGALHPSELKPPLLKVAVSVLEKVAAALTGGDAKKAINTLKNTQKKLAKQKSSG